MKVRDMAKATLEWLIDDGSLPTYEETGRFFEQAGGDPRFILTPPQQRITHYATLSGALYADETLWRKAFEAVESFIAAPATGRRHNRRLSQTLTLAGLAPDEALDELQSAGIRCGLQSIDKNLAAKSLLFQAEDVCAVIDLPEPYGKWLQHKLAKPAWDDVRSLRVEVACQMKMPLPGSALNQAPVDRSTHLELTCSAIPPALLSKLYTELSRGPRLRQLARPTLRREFQGALKDAVSRWLNERAR